MTRRQLLAVVVFLVAALAGSAMAWRGTAADITGKCTASFDTQIGQQITPASSS